MSLNLRDVHANRNMTSITHAIKGYESMVKETNSTDKGYDSTKNSVFRQQNRIRDLAYDLNQ
jgi:hypothetical protein